MSLARNNTPPRSKTNPVKRKRNAATTTGGATQVLVLGSIGWTRALVPASHGPLYVKHEGWVGAPIIRDMIIHSLSDTPSVVSTVHPAVHEGTTGAADDANASVHPNAAPSAGAVEEVASRLVATVNPGDPSEATGLLLRSGLGDTTAVFKDFLQASTSSKKTALRLAQNYREDVASVAGAQAARDAYLADGLEVGKALKSVDVLVVFDNEGSFIADLARTLESTCTSPPFKTKSLVVACRGSVDIPSLEKLTSCLGCPKSMTTFVVTASWIRKTGSNIVEYGSLEQTLKEVVDCAVAKTGAIPALLQRAAHAVIMFEETGAAYLRRDDKNTWKGSFHFCPNFDDVAQADPRLYGHSPGQTALVVSAVVRQIAYEKAPADLSPSLRLAVAASNLHFAEGFDRSDPFGSAKLVLSADRRAELQACETADTPAAKTECLVSSLTFEIDRDLASTWTRLGAWRARKSKQDIRRMLRELVRKGPEVVFRTTGIRQGNQLWHPAPSISCPYLRVGQLKTFDSEEIQGFLTLSKLIRQYLRNSDTKPLSIAVFGAPGSGKSTAVKELLDSVDPGSGKALLSYNLSQLDSVGALTEAFHQIQDRALASARPPFVMFDEFDCAFDKTPLGWLKYFLAPMQDGEFLGKSGVYKIGRAVFLFAGGTSPRFDDFQDRAKRGGKKARDEMKAVKLTDFVSRLLGYLNVRDVNPPSDQESATQLLQRQVKRALTLRFQLGKHAKEIVSRAPGAGYDELRIADAAIDAFIDAKRYEHGVRSMEAIVKMSRPVSTEFVIASLPARSLLDMHARNFLIAT